MVFFKFRWLRKVLRKNFHLPESVAEKWHRRLTIAYLILAWNAFGAVVYMTRTGRLDYAHYYGLKTDAEAYESKAVSTMHMLGIPKARVVTIQGLTPVSDVEITNEILQEELDDLNANIK